MMSKVISNWLEEGFSNLVKKSLKDDKKQEHTIFPVLIDESGVNITPTPLFSVFLIDTELDTNFLVEYFEIIQTGLRRGKKSEKTHSTIKDIDANKSSAFKRNIIDINYERKNLFLSSKIFSLFELADTYISNWSSEYPDVLSRNKQYKQAVVYRQKCHSNFQDKSTLIGNVDVSEKQIETMPIILEDKSFLVNAFLMGKHYDRKEISIKSTPKTFQQYIDSRTIFRDSKEFQQKLPENPEILKNVKKQLYVIERALDYNTDEKTIVSFNDSMHQTGFRNETSTVSEQTQSEYSTFSLSNARQRLQFYLPALQNKYYVSCIQCSFFNPNIFICGYSISHSEEMNHETQGVVLCWNINKSSYPERIYHFEEAVTCIDISESKPYLVAVGMCHGLVAVIDLRRPNSLSYITNRSSKDRSVGAIKSVNWILKKYSLNEMVEVLLVVSIDGIITSWNYRKHLEGNILTTVKHQNADQENKKQFHISNTALCMCMHPNPDNNDIFAAGTIEGKVFIMNLNKPEDNVTDKNCHFGSVNDIKWSPLAKNVFFTCGTDRRLHIWELDKTQPSKSLILPDNILSITLSSIDSTLFSAITEHKLYIFDLAANLHKPIVEIDSKENGFTSVNFCPHNDWLFVGLSDGKISLFEIINPEPKLKTIESDILRNIFLPEQ